MDNQLKQRLDLYTLYLGTAEKVSDRRWQANSWLLSVNSALVGLYGYLGKGPPPLAKAAGVWVWAIPAAGILVCLTWLAVLASFHKLNKAKFQLLQEIEQELPLALFKREQEIYRSLGRRRFSTIEGRVPWCFIALYGVLLFANLV